MEVLDSSAVVARIDALRADLARRGGLGAVAFDGDGTLWTGDIGDDFFHATVERDRFSSAATEAMRAVARGAGLRVTDHDSGVALARVLFQAYLDGTVGEDRICEMMGWAQAGWTDDELRRFAADVVDRVGLLGRRRKEIIPVLLWARDQGVEAFLVSASPRAPIEAASTALGLGIDPDHVLATTPVFERGVMTTDVVRPIPYGPGKASLLADALARRSRVLLGAFGDNIFDVPMLEAARLGVVVDPKPRLRAHLDALGRAPAVGATAFCPVQLRVD